jgi:hypothetical protein
MTRYSRRNFLGTAAAAGFAAPFAAQADTATRRTLDLTSPADCLTALIKMRGSLEAVDCPHWYFGTIYAMVPGKPPLAMVDFEGSEIDYYERQPDGSYHAHSATVSFFRDTQTRKKIDTFKNPITGKVNAVRPNSITVKAYYIINESGMKRSDDARPLQQDRTLPEQMKWTESDDYVWLNMNRPYPAGVPMGEDQTIQGSLRELHDPSTAKVHTTANPTYMAPWLRWMDMEGVAGHTVWAGPARKLDSVTQYPRELLDFMEQNYPEKLTAKPA